MAGTKRIFVSFAIEDRWARDFLRGQSRLGSSPINYTDFSVKRPFDRAWKTRCRSRICGCDGVIALLSWNVRSATGARWEIKCAVDEAVPVLGVWIGESRYRPTEISGKRVITWNPLAIGRWIDRL